MIVMFICSCDRWTYGHCRSFWTCNFCHRDCNDRLTLPHASLQYDNTGWWTWPHIHSRHRTTCQGELGVSSSSIGSHTRSLNIHILVGSWLMLIAHVSVHSVSCFRLIFTKLTSIHSVIWRVLGLDVISHIGRLG